VTASSATCPECLFILLRVPANCNWLILHSCQLITLCGRPITHFSPHRQAYPRTGRRSALVRADLDSTRSCLGVTHLSTNRGRPALPSVNVKADRIRLVLGWVTTREDITTALIAILINRPVRPRPAQSSCGLRSYIDGSQYVRAQKISAHRPLVNGGE